MTTVYFEDLVEGQEFVSPEVTVDKDGMLATFALASLAAPVYAQAAKEPAKTETKQTAPAPKQATLDLNTASADELKALPGIGEAYSKKIIENRPYTRRDELVKKKVIPQTTYDKIKDQIMVKQVKQVIE